MTDFSSTTSFPRDGVGLVELTGEVDLYTAPRFKQDLVGVIEAGARAVVVDLSGVTFIDSTALGVVISGVKRMAEVDGQLVVVASSRPVVRILDITGLDKVLTIVADRDAALAEV
jgi:anti-sigma B factor antagonist